MSAPIASKLQAGNAVRGTVYDFNAGDVLPDHSHDRRTNHISIVAKGVVEVTGDNAESGRRIASGEIITWVPGEQHGFKAITPARLINVLEQTTRVADDELI